MAPLAPLLFVAPWTDYMSWPGLYTCERFKNKTLILGNVLFFNLNLVNLQAFVFFLYIAFVYVKLKIKTPVKKIKSVFLKLNSNKL